MLVSSLTPLVIEAIAHGLQRFIFSWQRNKFGLIKVVRGFWGEILQARVDLQLRRDRIVGFRMVDSLNSTCKPAWLNSP